MFVSRQLKEKNIAEYLIYMWQIEDLIRANGCDMEKIKSTIIAPYPLTEEQKAELTQWYMDLIEMMRHEGIMEKGHLQINKNIITCYYTVEMIDGDYAHLKKMDDEAAELKLVARALLPEAIVVGSQLKYEMLQYELV